MIMGRCRACRRIAARRKKLGYWRPFVFFSIAVHLTATIAFSQLSMAYKGSVRDADLSVVQLVRVPQSYSNAGAAINKTARPLKVAAQKRAPNKSGNKTSGRVVSPINNKGALEERTVPSTAQEEKIVKASVPAPVKEEENDSGLVSDAAPKGVVIIRGVEKEVVMVDPKDAAAEKNHVIEPSGQENMPPLSGYTSSSPDEYDAPQAVNTMPKPEQEEKMNLANNDNFQGEAVVPEPVFSNAAVARIAAAVTLPIELPVKLSMNQMKSPLPSDVEPGIKIMRPNGEFSDESTVEVSGIVSGEGINSVNLLVNDVLWETPVQDGVFKEKVFLREGENEINATATDASGRKAEDSITITYRPSDMIVHFTCPQGCRLAYKWAPHPLGSGTGSPSPDEINIKEDTGTAVFSVRHAAPGIYTVMLGNDAPEAEDVSFEAALYGYDTTKHKARSYGPLKIQGKGQLAVVKVLMPEGIFWDEDSSFSGIIRDGSVTTKYKMPEGIVWKEGE